jgi:2-amino-4-hydroxy-6-hydroxymethyldihydropteridine diphosphokinase
VSAAATRTERYRLAVGLGSSLGDRRAHLALALASLAAAPDTRLVRVSALVRTPPLPGGTARNWFLNAVALFETSLTPDTVLDRCVALEARAGRRRARHWMDRPLDLDLLVGEGMVMDSARIVLPHPALTSRPFVLGPLLEVWPDVVDPRTGAAFSLCPPPPGPRPVVVGRLAHPHAWRLP